MTVNPEHFQILSDFKQRIGEVSLDVHLSSSSTFPIQRLKKINAIAQIKIALDKDRLLSDEVACHELRYFAYKSRGLSQYTSSKLMSPYTHIEQHVRLFEVIRYVYGRLHDPNHLLKIVYYTGAHESVLGWVSRTRDRTVRELDRLFSRLVGTRIRIVRRLLAPGDLGNSDTLY